ncbi:MAG: YkvA family protein [Chloroflexota bacterium]
MSDGNDFDKQEFFSLFFNPEVPFNLKFAFLAGVGLYTLSPIDLIPEALTGVFGLADDVGILIIATQIFTRLANNQLEKLHNAQQEAQATAAPPQQNVYSAHAAPLPPTETPPGAPQVIHKHHQTQRQIAPRQQPQQPPRAGDFLQDEAHEQYLNQKRQETEDEFERMVRQKEQEKQAGGWDYSRNDPFNKPKKK